MQTAPAASATVIAPGDLIATAASTSVPAPASAETWVTDLATTQTNFVAKFLGVSVDRSRNGDTDPVVCATSGVFEFDCDSATFAIGDLVGPAKQSGNALENQKVAAVASAARAIGRVIKQVTGTKVLVQITSTRLP